MHVRFYNDMYVDVCCLSQGLTDLCILTVSLVVLT